MASPEVPDVLSRIGLIKLQQAPCLARCFIPTGSAPSMPSRVAFLAQHTPFRTEPSHVSSENVRFDAGFMRRGKGATIAVLYREANLVPVPFAWRDLMWVAEEEGIGDLAAGRGSLECATMIHDSI